MICYRDMTFCPFWEECADSDCPRATTDKVREAAKAIGLPICFFANKPDCFKEVV